MSEEKTYTVIVPIAGHICVSVEAKNEDEAKEKAFDADICPENIEDLETLDTFIKGNVCYCPQPWEVEVIEE